MSVQVSRSRLNYPSLLQSRQFSIFWIAWFLVCLLPVSSSGGFSVNYLFVFTPTLSVLMGGRLFYPPKLINLFFLVSCMVFLISLIYQVDFYEYSIRRTTSFIVFLTLFALPLINFSDRMVNSFFAAVVFVSLYYSVVSITGFLTIGVLDPATLKDLIGSQRLGFVYLFALWILLQVILDSFGFTRFLAIGLLLVIFVGLIFTFSRSSYVALIAGVMFTFAFYFFRLDIKASWLKTLALGIISFFLLLFLLFVYFPQFYQFLDQRLLVLTSPEFMLASLSNPATSEGTRVAIWGLIIEFVMNNPFTGTGFLGSWVLSDWSGSAHNEFFDRLLRLGLIGFSLYIVVIYKMFSFLVKKYPSVAFGFVSILCYGMFHETFSQSQGAVIFSFLLMLYSRHCRESRSNENIANRLSTGLSQ